VVRDEGADVLGVTFVLMKGKKNKTELRMVAS